jgi:DNA primase
LYSEEELLDYGLCRYDDDNTLQPFFRSRIMIPIRNDSGKVVGFTGRKFGTTDDKKFKYLNSIETKHFNKSKLLYGLYESKTHIIKTGYAIVVEGNIDRDRLFLSGIKNVVATCGTAITDYQLQMLFMLCKNVYLLMDGDKAGKESAQRTTDMVNNVMPKYSNHLKIAIMPDGYDPDTFALKYAFKNDNSVVVQIKALLNQSKILKPTEVEKPTYIPMEKVENIYAKERVDVEKLVSGINIKDIILQSGVALRKGGRNWNASCPFHSEKTASFMVSEEKQLFKCFGCGKGGNVIKFLELRNNWTFIETINYLRSL